MFTPIKDEINLLVNDLIIMQNILVDEQNEIANNTCSYIKYEGMISQVQSDIERVNIAKSNLNLIIENIMKNAADGSYSAKMDIVERENEVLRDKIDILETQIKTLTNSLNNENKIRTKKETEIEENLEL